MNINNNSLSHEVRQKLVWIIHWKIVEYLKEINDLLKNKPKKLKSKIKKTCVTRKVTLFILGGGQDE